MRDFQTAPHRPEKEKSRRCPHCKSKKTQRVGEFAVCLKCKEPFHHNSKDEILLEPETNEVELVDTVDAIGGTYSQNDDYIR